MAARFLGRNYPHERHDQLMRVAALGAARREQFGHREDFDQSRFLTRFDPVNQDLDTQDVVEIKGKFVVAIREGHESWKPMRVAKLLEGSIPMGAGRFA